VKPSTQLARLRGLLDRLSNCMMNQFFAPIAILFGLHFHILSRIHRWKERVGPTVPDWLVSIGEWEVLLSMSGHAYEFPDSRFPELVESETLFEAKQLVHPILTRGRCVANDVKFSQAEKLLLVSGSNMSGKSTLLRTVGVNTVLALAGGVVHAQSLRLSVFQIGAAMRVSDSLQDGKSLFYAVVTRLKQIVDLAEGEKPLLYLIDEILPGTNSHDRRLGAEGVLRNLIERNAVGLVTTHDLALTKIADSLGGRANNVHFEDHLEAGKMTFDYQLRPGVVQKSNALELMKMIGLEIGNIPESRPPS
jgi:DNA mismatch repair ATPase MutS